MRLSRGICIALALAAPFTLAAAPALAAESRPACDRDCLGGFVDRVLQAMMDHAPAHAPLAPDVRYTENGAILKPGEGFWSTATAIAMAGDGLSTLGRNSSAYRLYFADVASGQAAYFGAVTDKGAPGMMMLRLRVIAGKVSEIETVVVLQEATGQGGADGLPDLDPRGFDEPEATLLAGGERWSPTIMAAAAGRYLDSMTTGSSAGVPLGADCVRRDNGIRTTAVPDATRLDPANPASRSYALGCAAQLDSGFFRGILRVRWRPLVVDQERGLVMAAAMVDRGTRPEPPKKKARGRRAQAPEPVPTESTALLGLIFKMSDGKITRVEVIERPAAKDMALGWPG